MVALTLYDAHLVRCLSAHGNTLMLVCVDIAPGALLSAPLVQKLDAVASFQARLRQHVEIQER